MFRFERVPGKAGVGDVDKNKFFKWYLFFPKLGILMLLYTSKREALSKASYSLKVTNKAVKILLIGVGYS